MFLILLHDLLRSPHSNHNTFFLSTSIKNKSASIEVQRGCLNNELLAEDSNDRSFPESISTEDQDVRRALDCFVEGQQTDDRRVTEHEKAKDRKMYQ